jgi:transcriptional regulator with XRE-family HTH domain
MSKGCPDRYDGVVMQVVRKGRSEAELAETRSPVLRRRELGALLRALRTEAGLTVEQVAESILVSPSKVSRLETGQRGASLRDIRDLCNLYQVQPAQRENMVTLARQGRGQAWWQPYGLPYETYVGLEAEAAHISDYEPGVFPGLLQIPDYARAIHESAMPRLSPAVIEQRIEVRLIRQAVLTREEAPPPLLEAIIDEAILHRPVGGPSVMSAQIDSVIEASELPNVTVRVLPFAAGAHPALDSTFILLEFEDPLPGVVYVEGLVGLLYVERSQDVQRYRQVFERLQTVSLDEHRSVDLMSRMSAAYKKK